MVIIFGNNVSSTDDDVCLTSFEGRFNFAGMVRPYACDCSLLGYHSYGDKHIHDLYAIRIFLTGVWSL
jgi:hypothetical protein